MARSLNSFIFCFLFLLPCLSFSQIPRDAEDQFRPKDYKGKDFKRYNKRATAISKWQINQLKDGALMVRLKTNQNKIDALKKLGKMDLAAHEENEMFVINKSIVRAYLKSYTFSKVYFFYSNFSDTLLKGARSGIFLDSNLVTDPSLKYDGNYYLVAEEGLSYDSSIGFVPEDSARIVTEAGSTPVDCYVVVKNKYYNQLKHPFPFRILYWGISQVMTDVYMVNASGKIIHAKVSKSRTPEKYDHYIFNFSNNLQRFYEESKDYQVTDPKLKPFLY
jgi:hypothetical protein